MELKAQGWDGKKWFLLGQGIKNGEVYCIVVRDSMVYVGGNFSRAGGKAANGIARWDGKEWHTLGEGVTYHPTPDPDVGGTITYEPPPNPDGSSAGSVRAIAFIGSDLVAAGFFEGAGKVAANGIARWDGKMSPGQICA